ncbi:MAG: polysaccharide biosynthesis C-terminal domain-containing protein [Pseudomonadota bacterium]
MLIAAVKLTDIGARAFFVLIVLYSLSARLSGQFGLALTLIGFFSFFSGYERYIDLQRVLVGKTASEGDVLIRSVLRFFGLNYLLWLPVLAVLLHWWVQLTPLAVALWLLIALGEHFANEAYRMALVTHRHRHVLLVGLAKNLVLVSTVAYASFAKRLDCEQLLIIWATLSTLAITVSVGMFILRSIPATPSQKSMAFGLIEQYRRSRTHFLIGLVAVTSLQIDRLVAGGFLTLENSGVYFRHIFLASSTYQVFGVVSHNRIMVRIYGSMLAGKPSEVRSIIRREQWRYVPLTLGLIGFILLAGPVAARDVAAFSTIVPHYLAVLMLAYLVRGIADYNSMILNAVYAERQIFKSQLITVLLTTTCSILLTPLFGLPGLIVAVLAGTTIYFLLTGAFARRMINLKMKEEQP